MPCQDQTISVWHKLHQLSHLPNLGSGVEVFFKASWALRMLGAWTWRLDHRVTASSHRSYLRISLRLSRKLACIFPKWLWVCTRQSPGSTVKFHKSLHVIELLGSSGQFATHSDQVTPPRLDGGGKCLSEVPMCTAVSARPVFTSAWNVPLTRFNISAYISQPLSPTPTIANTPNTSPLHSSVCFRVVLSQHIALSRSDCSTDSQIISPFSAMAERDRLKLRWEVFWGLTESSYQRGQCTRICSPSLALCGCEGTLHKSWRVAGQWHKDSMCRWVVVFSRKHLCFHGFLFSPLASHLQKVQRHGDEMVGCAWDPLLGFTWHVALGRVSLRVSQSPASGYTESQRAYHTLSHLDEMFGYFQDPITGKDSAVKLWQRLDSCFFLIDTFMMENSFVLTYRVRYMRNSTRHGRLHQPSHSVSLWAIYTPEITRIRLLVSWFLPDRKSVV